MVINRQFATSVNSKKASISAVRMTAMILIITCHLFQFYGNELSRWFNVGVQLFFLISGYLYGKKEITDPICFFVKNSRKILVPYYIFIIFALVLYGFFARESLSLSSVFKSLFCAGTIKGLGHLWFVSYILFCYFLTPYLFWLRKKVESLSFSHTLFLYGSILFLYQILGVVYSSFYKPDRISCYLIGFFIADLYIKCSKNTKDKIKYVLVIGAIIMNIGRALLLYYFTNPSIPHKIIVFYVHYSHLLLGLMLFVVLMKTFKKIKYNNFLLFSDKYSYPIYIVHLLFIISPFTLLNSTPFILCNLLICLFSILILALFLNYSSNFVNNKIFRK